MVNEYSRKTFVNGVIPDEDSLNQLSENIAYLLELLGIKSSAQPSSNQTLSNGDKINFETEEWDLGSNYDAPNSKFVAPVDGYYRVTGILRFSSGIVSDAKYYASNVYINGVNNSKAVLTQSGSTTFFGTETVMTVHLEADDYVELYLGTNSGTTQQLDATGCLFQVELVGVD